MSLADELLADLEEDGPIIESDSEGAAEDQLVDDVDDVEDIQMDTTDASMGVKRIAKLKDSEQVNNMHHNFL